MNNQHHHTMNTNHIASAISSLEQIAAMHIAHSAFAARRGDNGGAVSHRLAAQDIAQKIILLVSPPQVDAK